MKRAILLGTLALILSIGVLVFAQGPGMWGGGYGMGPGTPVGVEVMAWDPA